MIQTIVLHRGLGDSARAPAAWPGTALIENCMEEVEGDASCGVLYLHLITSNRAAIRFYEKLGFYRVRRVPITTPLRASYARVLPVRQVLSWYVKSESCL
jgi:hypothetical protein